MSVLPNAEAWSNHGDLNEWFANGERGISSDTIVMHLTGRIHPRYPDHPYDPSDVRRCELLLRRVPLLRLVFGEMATLSPVWAAFVARWDDIVALMEEEVPGCLDRRVDGAAPKAYALIQECRRADRDR